MGFTYTILRWIEYQSELNDVFRAERVCIDQDECVRYSIMFAKYTEKYTSPPPIFLDIGFRGRSRIEIASSNPMLYPVSFLDFELWWTLRSPKCVMQRFSGRVLDSRPRHCEFEIFVILRLEFFTKKLFVLLFSLLLTIISKYVKFHLTLKISFLWLYTASLMNIIMLVYLLFVVTLSKFCKQSALCAGS